MEKLIKKLEREGLAFDREEDRGYGERVWLDGYVIGYREGCYEVERNTGDDWVVVYVSKQPKRVMDFVLNIDEELYGS